MYVTTMQVKLVQEMFYAKTDSWNQSLQVA